MPSSLSRGRVLGSLLATALFALGPAATAVAREGVYGGVTRGGDPIVITTDANARKITGAVFRIRVNGDDGDWWPIAGKAQVRTASPDSQTIATGVLMASTNARGRFEARLLTTVESSPDRVALGGIILKGTLKPGKASGTIMGWVTVTNPETMELVGNYETRSVKWTAERSAGRVYGGALANDMPIVLKLDRRATKVSEIGLVCHIDLSTPPGWFWDSSEWLSDFRLRSGRFGDTFRWSEQEADWTATYDWKIAGRVTAKSATGSVALTTSVTESSGDVYTFVMPATKFTAATG
jgi:hypothetical protein